jgi:Lysozyme inhibitor LprI
MPSLARFLCLPDVVPARMVVAQFTLAGVLVAPLLMAQAPQDNAAPPPPSPIALQNPIPGSELMFLNGFAGKPVKELLKDKAFINLTKQIVPKTTYHYGRDMALSFAVDDVLDGSKLPVMLRDGRYLMVSGDRGPYLRGRGFLWFDLQEGVALGGFFFTPTNGEPTPTLTIFSKQVDTHELAMSELPQAFVQDLYQWEEIEKVPPVSPRYFIPVNGKKYVLVHDEDYCWHPDGAPAPDPNACQEMNAAAADADLNAAYFMHLTRNAADATAWMLEPEQVAWLDLRERSCFGPDRLACRIHMARERTWTLIGGPPPKAPRARPMQASR